MNFSELWKLTKDLQQCQEQLYKKHARILERTVSSVEFELAL